MAKINIYLKGALSKENLDVLKRETPSEFTSYQQRPLPLVFYCSYNSERVQVPIGISVPPKFWDVKHQKIKNIAETPSLLLEKNKDIKEKKEKIENYFELTIANRKAIKKEEIKSLLSTKNIEVIFEDKFSSTDSTIDYFIQEYRKVNGFLLHKNTKKKFNTLKNLIRAFLSEKSKNFNWCDADIRFMKAFQNYMYDVKKYNDNSATKYIQALKTVLKFLKTQGLKIPDNAFDIKVQEFEKPIIVLELKELELLRNFQFNEPHLAKVRDVFIFASWTGQRYSDVSTIKREDLSVVNSNKVWLVSTIKTQDSLTVPLNDYALEILNRYHENEDVIPKFTGQHFNRELKKMASVVGLDRQVPIATRIRGIKTQTLKPIKNVLTSHIARKSFITNSLILGMSETEVKKISGHKDGKSFRKYVELGNSVLTNAKSKLSAEKVKLMIEFLGAN